VNFGIELGRGADDQFMAAQRDRAIHLPVNLQIFIASDLPFDLNASAEARRAAGSRTSKARCGRNTERNDWGRGTGRRRSGGWFCDSLRFGPHNASLIQTQRMNEAPGGKEQRELTVDARSSAEQRRKGIGLRSSKLSVRTGRAVPGFREVKDATLAPWNYCSVRRTRRMPKAIIWAGKSRRNGIRKKPRNCHGMVMAV